uniref:Uncharacterized protein n=1 Tax=Anopheles christyi TaxID=43041 RepID=A0A182KI36_9DIPT
MFPGSTCRAVSQTRHQPPAVFPDRRDPSCCQQEFLTL